MAVTWKKLAYIDYDADYDCLLFDDYKVPVLGAFAWQKPVLNLRSSPIASDKGDRYLVIAPASGDWTGKEDYIAEYNGASWDFTPPLMGMWCYVIGLDVIYFHDLIVWAPLDARYINHSLATAANDFIVASGSGTFVKKTLAETRTILSLPALNYAVGDLLYANTTTTLAKLADVAVNNALISGGIGVAPGWGKIGLTTHVDGILPVANGGTGGDDAWGTAQDPGHKHSKLWASDGSPEAVTVDAAGNVGIGCSPGAPLEISTVNVSQIRLTRTGYNYWEIGGIYNLTNIDLLFSMAGSEKMRIDAAGNVGIGCTAGAKVQIADYHRADLWLYSPVNSNFLITTTDAMAIDKGGVLSLGAVCHDTGPITYGLGHIRGAKENATPGDISGYLSFLVSQGGVGTIERMRIDSVGNVGIGITTFGTNAVGVLGIGSDTAPSDNPVNMAQMWVEDVNGAAGYAGFHKMTETTAQKEVIPGVIIKTDTGSPANPYEGLMEINTFDNKVRMYADAAWRELGTW